MQRQFRQNNRVRNASAIQPGDVVRIHGYDVQYYGVKQAYAPHKGRHKGRTVEAELHCYQKVTAGQSTQYVLVLRACFHDPAENLPIPDCTRIPYQVNYPISRLAGIVLTLQSGAPILFFPNKGQERLRTNTIGWFGKTGPFTIETVSE